MIKALACEIIANAIARGVEGIVLRVRRNGESAVLFVQDNELGVHKQMNDAQAIDLLNHFRTPSKLLSADSRVEQESEFSIKIESTPRTRWKIFVVPVTIGFDVLLRRTPGTDPRAIDHRGGDPLLSFGGVLEIVA